MSNILDDFSNEDLRLWTVIVLVLMCLLSYGSWRMGKRAEDRWYAEHPTQVQVNVSKDLSDAWCAHQGGYWVNVWKEHDGVCYMIEEPRP